MIVLSAPTPIGFDLDGNPRLAEKDRQTVFAFILLIQELKFLKPVQVNKWVRPIGTAPRVYTKSIGNSGLIKLRFSRELIVREKLPTSEDLKFIFLPYDG